MTSPARTGPTERLRVRSDNEFASEQGDDAMGFSGPLSDRVEIRELYETYVDAVAMNDAELWASTWVDDCVWHIAGQTTEGKDKTVALWKPFMDSFSRLVLRIYRLGRGRG
jgi:SnoaL-like domain